MNEIHIKHVLYSIKYFVLPLFIAKPLVYKPIIGII